MKKFLTILLLFTSFYSKAIHPENINSLTIEWNATTLTNLSYDRFIDINSPVLFYVGGDLIIGNVESSNKQWLSPECGMMLFGPNHFIEAGVQMMIDISLKAQYRTNSPVFKVGYRFVGNKGLTLKMATSTIPGIDPMFFPVVGIGYTF